MKRVPIDKNKSAIYLDHRELIRKTYTIEGKQTYALKTELFAFHAKAKENDCHSTPQAESPMPKSKRKRKMTTNELPIELKALQMQSTKLLQQLRNEGIKFDNNITVNAEILPRYWESTMASDFPQFNGANATNEFQSYRLQSQTYLIPPQCRFFNCDLTRLTQLLPQLNTRYDLIVLDPPWRNKYIRRLKRARQELGYKMLDNAELQTMPIAELIHERSIVAIWCTNSHQHQQALDDVLLPAWNLRLLHSLKWLKVNTSGTLISPINAVGHKQPFEMLYIACQRTAANDFAASIRADEMLLSTPSIVHSHKPSILPWLSEWLPKNAKCLELFARYLQPQFTSIGLEVLKLMDARLYDG